MASSDLTIGQLSFDIPVGTNLSQTASFVPLSVMVDNYSPYYLLIPDAGSYVPPWTIGAIFPLIHASVCKAEWANPQSTAIATVTYEASAGFAHLRFLDTALPPSSGTPLAQSALTGGLSVQANVGQSITVTPSILSFLAIGIRIDNPSGTSYQIQETSQVIPMFTSGWTIDIDPPFNTLHINPYQIPGTTTNKTIGGPITAFFYPYNIGQNGGTTIPTISYPTFVQSASIHQNGTLQTSLSITFSSAPLNGDLILLAVGAEGGTTTFPTGFTQLIPTSSTGTCWLGAKISNGTEGTTFTVTNTGTYLVDMVGLIYRNVQGIYGSISSAAQDGTSTTIPSSTWLGWC